MSSVCRGRLPARPKHRTVEFPNGPPYFLAHFEQRTRTSRTPVGPCIEFPNIFRYMPYGPPGEAAPTRSFDGFSGNSVGRRGRRPVQRLKEKPGSRHAWESPFPVPAAPRAIPWGSPHRGRGPCVVVFKRWGPGEGKNEIPPLVSFPLLFLFSFWKSKRRKESFPSAYKADNLIKKLNPRRDRLPHAGRSRRASASRARRGRPRRGGCREGPGAGRPSHTGRGSPRRCSPPPAPAEGR